MLHDAVTQDAAVSSRVLAGRYRLNRPIGAGGMGEVWHAYDERLDRRVAVKMMLADVRGQDAASPGTWSQEVLRTRRGRFLREVRTTAAVEHLGIPAVYDTGIDDLSGRLYVVMQLLTGRELQAVVDETDHESAPLPVSWVAAAGAQIASVLDEVHRHDVVHRDIKPANLMLTRGGVVKVLDFGVAALLGTGSNPRLTQEGMTVGTPAYMSPEQSLANAVGPAADVYALGCVLYELLTGQPPFCGDGNRSYAWHHVRTPPRPVRGSRPDVPADMERLLLAMLEKEPERRLDAAAVYEALLPWVHADDTGYRYGRELDPRHPFHQPFGGPPERQRHRYTPTEVAPAALVPHESASDTSALTDQEADELADEAARLAQDGQFTQASDLLTEAIARAGAPGQREDLLFSLAQVRFLGGAHREAAGHFEDAGRDYAVRFGADDEQALLCRYFAAQCRMELGETTAAVDAFRDYVAGSREPGDAAAVDRHLDALASLARLYASTERMADALAAAAELRQATQRLRGPQAPELADIDGYLARLRRFSA
ncbi:serine/threonine-protein kinase [Streptomyces sp. WAC05950]|uniref:serine/threonine-protein kinase n=1 Tax=Streptomyces sp. WAC05950 TaxID=2487419 RepID=UPI000F73826E|nr:serine/threonine-protein kinase [Streptomyces sp. WAC05950]RSS85328.1 serine/threonine protein kinase [Streptomyces sp. WAC05950]